MDAFFSNQLLFGESILNRLHIFAGSWLDAVMAAFSFMGNETFYVIFIPVIYWCFDKKLSIRIGGAFLMSVIFNNSIKDLFQNPRPSAQALLEGIRDLHTQYVPHDSPGFPSGHAQNAVAFWGSFAYYLKNRYALVISIMFIVLISYSRLYLAVHFLGDVLGGLVFGILFLAGYIAFIRYIEKRSDFVSPLVFIAISLVIPFVLMLVLPVYDISKPLGVISGFLTGYILEKDRISFNPDNSLLPQITKLLIGFAGILLIKEGLPVFLPKGPSSDFLRYWLLGIWITFFAPYVFMRITGLQGSKPD
jgi:membrane-associated phospholipid phosphatase